MALKRMTPASKAVAKKVATKKAAAKKAAKPLTKTTQPRSRLPITCPASKASSAAKRARRW